MAPAGIWNLLSSRVILSTVLLGYGLVFIIRPHLWDTVPAFRAFTHVIPISVWVAWPLLTWASMLLAPKQSAWQLVAFLAASVYFFLVAALIVAGVGLTPYVWTTVIEGLSAAAMYGQAQSEMFSRSRLFRRLAKHPPKWFRVGGRYGRK